VEKEQVSAQLAYIAGLFDGEGCVQFKKRMETKGRLKSGKIRRSNSTIITLEISMTDQPVIRWIHKILKVGSVNINIKNKSPSSKPHWKDQLRWRCGYRDALKVAKLLFPYARVKREKLQQIIKHYDKFSLRYTNDRDVRVHNAVSGDGNCVLNKA
jgi:hypothetical protein